MSLINSSTLRYHSYTISFDRVNTYPMSSEVEKVCTKMNNLLSSDIKKAYQELQIATQKYPADPTLQVFLSVAIARNENDIKAAKPLIIKNYQQFPNYFFALYMYVELCLEEENLEETAKAFDNKFDLHLRYPNRSVFHISEVLSFSSICAMYFYLLGKNERAEIYVKMIRQLDDQNPLIEKLENYASYCARSNMLKKFFRINR